jgi:CYTH domain-containing protein
MAKEIERKFLVASDSYKKEAKQVIVIRQGYISVDNEKSVRVRRFGQQAFLAVKSSRNGLERLEYEYAIPVGDADEMLDKLCGNTIEKNRYHVPYGQHLWEVDEFFGDNEGLVIAEIELQSADEPFEKPVWLEDEVTFERAYYNAMLIKNPYKNWKKR